MKLLLILLLGMTFISCSGDKDPQTVKVDTSSFKAKVYPFGDKKDLNGLKWITNDADPILGDPSAKKGGTFRSFMMSFPLTTRYVGPDSNGSFRDNLDANRFEMLKIHPITKKFYPVLVKTWAIGSDNKSIFFKLDPDVRWSDGHKFSADDCVFTLDFMRSKHIVAPWYNNYYTEFFDRVIKYDDYTVGIFAKKKMSDYELQMKLPFDPQPKHFFEPGLNKNWVKTYQWKVAPNLGPYNISEIKKGKSITFTRTKNWWGENKRYFKHRFNVDKVRIKVVREKSVAFELFLKGKLDTTGLTIPEEWHVKADINKVQEFRDGYIHKIWFYNDVPQPNFGIFLNQDYELFKDINVRKAFGHAMNIEKVLKTVLRGDYQRQHNSTEGRGLYTNNDIRAREFSLEKVDEYMKMAGWDKRGPDGIREKDGKRMEVTLTTGYAHHKDRLVVVKEEAKKAGIDIKINLMDGATSFKTLLEKQHQMAWMGWNTGVLPQYWEGFHSDNAHKKQTNNITNTDDPKMDELINTYRNVFEDSKKQRLSREIQKRMHELAAYIPTFLTPYTRGAYWRWVKLPNPKGINDHNAQILSPFWAGRFWIDKDLKEETLKAKKDGKKFEPVVIVDETYKRKS